MLGIITLDGSTPRVPGDVGHPDSYRIPVLFEMARGATIGPIVAGVEEQQLPQLITAGYALAERGARVIGTTCGLLTRLQPTLADELGIPVAVSAMLQLPLALAAVGPGRRIALLTADATLITQQRMLAAGVPVEQLDRIRVIDLVDAPSFYRALTGQLPALDVRQAGAEITRIVCRVLSDEPDIAGIVSECANLPPYSPELRQATRRPVWDALSQLHWLWSAVTGCPIPAAATEHDERGTS